MENYKVLEKQVNSKETFLQFLEAFIADLHDSQEKERQSPSSHYGPLANNWENPSLDRFLEAMHTWAFTSFTDTGELNVPGELS